MTGFGNDFDRLRSGQFAPQVTLAIDNRIAGQVRGSEGAGRGSRFSVTLAVVEPRAQPAASSGAAAAADRSPGQHRQELVVAAASVQPPGGMTR
jgi:hypothetical protein